MLRHLTIYLFSALVILLPAPAQAQQTQISVDEGFSEQVTQLTENFEALQSSFVQGQEKITELEEKLAKLKANEKLMSNPAVRSALQKAEEAGLSNKLANSKTMLSGFEKGAKTVASGASDAVGKFNEIKGYYDRWNPNSDSATRPLELVGASLEELQSLIYTLDPSPDNLLTKPIGEFIGFYKDATQAFVGALNRTQTAINNRRQNCIGTGCGLGSIGGSKDADFIALGTGHTIRMVREIRPAYGPIGELWTTIDGTAYIYQISRTGLAVSEALTRTTGQWFTMRCGVGQFDQVYKGMLLAYGEVATVPNLISRCNQDFAVYEKAMKRAADYWALLNPSRDDAFCTTKIVSRRGFSGEPKRTLEEANNDRDTFIAMYTFKPRMRQSVDRLMPAFSGSIFLQGRISLTGAETVSNGNIAVTLSGASGSTSLQADQTFELDLPVDADAGRRVGQLRFSTPGFDDYETDVAIDGACADLGTISIALQSQNSIDYSQHEKALQEMRSLAAQAAALGRSANALADGMESPLAIIDGELASLQTDLSRYSGKAGPAAAGGSSAGADQILDLQRQASAIATRMSQIRQIMQQRTLAICQGYERIDAAFDMGSVEAIYSELSPAKSTVDQLFAEYTSLRGQLENLNGQAVAIHQNGTSVSSVGNPVDGDANALSTRIDQAGNQLSQIESRLTELLSTRDQIADLFRRGQALLGEISMLDREKYGPKGDGIVAQIQSAFGQINGDNGVVIARAESASSLFGDKQARLTDIRTAFAAVKQNKTSATAGRAGDDDKAARDIALNSFTVSYDTALLYTDSIESSADSAAICNNAALAIYNHRHELDQLAGGGSPSPEPPSGPSGSGEQVVSTVPEPQPQPSEQVAATEPEPQPEQPAELVETQPEPRRPAPPPQQPAPVVVAESPPEPADPCTTKKVLGLFARADRALANEDIAGWTSAARKISGRGCQNGRLEASIAQANALVDRQNEERETAARIAAVEDRMPKPPKKPGGRGIGNLLGAIGSVIGAVNSARGGGSGGLSNPNGGVGGLLGSILGGESRREPVPQSTPQPAPQGNSGGIFNRGSKSGGLGALGNAGVVNDPRLADAMARRVGATRGNANQCRSWVLDGMKIQQHAVRASSAGNGTRAYQLNQEALAVFKKACNAGCSNVDRKFCR